MSDNYNLQLAICGSTATAGPISFSLPAVEQVILPDFNTLKNHVNDHSKSHSFIILFSDFNNENSYPDLEDLKKEAHVFAVYIRVQAGWNLTFSGSNVFPVAKQFIAQKIASSIIQFYERASGKLLASNDIFRAHQFKKRVNAMKHQRRSTNSTIRACHALIIPMNVTEDHLYDFQERLINLCNDLCGDYEPIVGTLGDYFSSDENSDIYGRDGIGIKCNFIKAISYIRIYLIGNETLNLHSFSQPLFESESTDPALQGYDEKYTFVEYEPVTENTKLNLSNVLGVTWQPVNMTLKRLDIIENDIEFPAALERVHCSHESRATTAISELNRQAMINADSSIEVSGAFRTIRQVPNGASRAIDDLIQK